MPFKIPTPARGWPEFIDDVVIVVVGVILALSAQEFVGRLHQRSAYRETRKNVFDEVAHDLGRLQQRLDTQACINDRLRALKILVAGDTPLPQPLWVGRPQLWGTDNGRWQAAVAAQQQDAFTSDELARLSTLYSSLDKIWEFQTDEQRAWARLRALEDVTTIDRQFQDDLVLALQQARLSNYQLHVAISQALDEGAHADIRPIRGTVRGSQSVCLPLRISRTEALMRLGRNENDEP
jgi:hypothetical protein